MDLNNYSNVISVWIKLILLLNNVQMDRLEVPEFEKIKGKQAF